MMVRGRSMSRGRLVRSIFSFTSIKIKSISEPCSNSIKILPRPSRVSVRISVKWLNWVSWLRNGLIIVASSSRADRFSAVTCTVTCGILTSGIRDTGSRLIASIPSTSIAISDMVTAIGLLIRNSTIPLASYSCFTITPDPCARFRLPEMMTTSPSFSSALLSAFGTTT